MAIIILTSILFFVWPIFEIVTMCNQGLHHFIRGKGTGLLKKEFKNCQINPVDNKIIGLNDSSEIHGRYVAKTGTSIIFPYYLCSYQGYDYGILIFSKPFFMTRRKFKELKVASNKKRLKFSEVV